MARDYAKIKAMAQSILECIGDEEEGENPSLPKQKQDINDGGQDSPLKLFSDDEGTESESEEEGEYESSEDSEEKKKKKASSMAMMSQMLSKKFNK